MKNSVRIRSAKLDCPQAGGPRDIPISPYLILTLFFILPLSSAHKGVSIPSIPVHFGCEGLILRMGTKPNLVLTLAK